ncbi:MAG: hypothetical protein AB7E61_06885 [Acholeplasmataceae bacterium]
MSIFKFETSFPFPIVKVTTLIHHTEVSKPTGISYIILVLINESTNRKEKLSNLLIQFGVPEDLQGIFADEIYKLIHEFEIIECKPFEYNRTHFSEYSVGHFVFTEKGEKVFREELIPAAKSIESKQELFYDPVHNTLMDKISANMQIGRIESCILPREVAERFEYKDIDSIEEYLNGMKGKGIVVKKDEIITDVSIMSNDYFFTKYPIILNIDNEKHTIEFVLGDVQTQTFFETQFDNKLVCDELSFKRKFKFNGNQPPLLDTNVIDGGKLMLPEQYEEILNKTAPMVITKSNYMPKQSDHVIDSSSLLSSIDPNIETIHILNNDKIIAYVPAKVSLKNPHSDKVVSINLLSEFSLDKETKQKMIVGLMDEFKNYSPENIKEGFYVFKILNERENLKHLFEQYLSTDIETNISILKEIKDIIDITFIKDWFQEQAQKAYSQYFEKLPFKTLDHQLAVGGWLVKHLNIQDVLMINKIIESNPNEAPMKLFTQLESLNYSLNDILSQIDVLDEFIPLIINNDKINITGNFSNLIKTIQFGLNQLKEMTGIKNPHQFIIKEDIDGNKFQDVFNGFSTKYSELLKYEKYNMNVFDELKEYNKHFKYLGNLFAEEKNASSNPKGINQNFIESKINQKDYFSAVVYLFAKLEWILKDQYKLSGTTEIMINQLKDVDEVKDFVPELHKFRKTRNSLIHPSNNEVKLNPNDIDRWKTIVFKEVMKA